MNAIRAALICGALAATTPASAQTTPLTMGPSTGCPLNAAEAAKALGVSQARVANAMGCMIVPSDRSGMYLIRVITTSELRNPNPAALAQRGIVDAGGKTSAIAHAKSASELYDAELHSHVYSDLTPLSGVGDRASFGKLGSGANAVVIGVQRDRHVWIEITAIGGTANRDKAAALARAVFAK